jgi:hypothetical protein
MAFTFKERDIRVAIGNNWYVIHMGNASMLDAVAKAKKALNDLDINESGDCPARTVSGLLRDYVGAVLGTDAQNAIFESREPNPLDELELAAFLVETMEAEGAKTDSDGLVKMASDIGIESSGLIGYMQGLNTL